MSISIEEKNLIFAVKKNPKQAGQYSSKYKIEIRMFMCFNWIDELLY